MSYFEREKRYEVIKLKGLDSCQQNILKQHMARLHINIKPINCVVVEEGWPIYEQTWDAVQRLAEGKPQRVAELQQQLEQVNARVNELEKTIKEVITDFHGSGFSVSSNIESLERIMLPNYIHNLKNN